MKTNEMTLTSASHRNLTAAQWLSSSNAMLSTLLGCRISNLSFIGVIAFAIFTLATIITASDACQAYGWSAFFALAAFNSVISLFREFKEGGK